MGLLTVILLFLPSTINILSDDVIEKPCELEWVECTDEDTIGDCEIEEQLIETGPYWNRTTETKLTLRKQVCKE